MSQTRVDLMDVHQAAIVARRSPETVRRWVWSGRLGARKLGRRLMIARTDLDALLSARPDARPGSLADWVHEVEAARGASAPRGGSAADLVFEDRRRRSTSPSRHGGR